MNTNILSCIEDDIHYLFGLILKDDKYSTLESISKLTKKSTGILRRKQRKEKDFNSHLMSLIRAANIDLRKGSFSIDETVYSKPYMEFLKLSSSQYSPGKKGYTKGFKIILLVWSDGEKTIPVAFKLWYKNLGKTQLEVAKELIRYAEKLVKRKHLSFRFDAFYNKKSILSYLHQRNISFATRLEKSRNVLIGKQLSQLKTIQFNGRCLLVFLPGVGKVWITKYKRKYYCSNIRPEYQRQLYEWYAERWCIECVFRFVKSELGLEHCRSIKTIQHYNHIGLCFVAYSFLNLAFEGSSPYENKRIMANLMLNKSVRLTKQAKKLIA